MPGTNVKQELGLRGDLRTSQVLPSLSRDKLLVEIRNRCVLIRSLNPDSIVLIMKTRALLRLSRVLFLSFLEIASLHNYYDSYKSSKSLSHMATKAHDNQHKSRDTVTA